MSRLLPVCVLVALALSGCRIERHLLAEPGRSQAVRVESGDRFYFDLPEQKKIGGRWYATCDDPDVDVTVDHDPDDEEAEVRIRIHRGYDGPSTVRFFYRRPGWKAKEKSFTITLYKRPGDFACWE